MNFNKDIEININGIGLILYSDFSTSHIAEGEDYFSKNYQTPQQVVRHIMKGSIVGFCTSSPGKYILKLREGYPTESELVSAEFKLRLGIEIRDSRICIRDLFDLMSWKKDSPTKQCINLENGFYHITLFGDISDSGVLGDNQIIYVYLNKLNGMPLLKYNGVPIFCE